MEKDIIIPLLIGALILATLGLLVAVSILAYLLLKKTNASQNDLTIVESTALVSENSTEIIDHASEPSLPQTEGLCRNHRDIVAQGTCAICGDLFCEKCLKSYEMLHFCSEHYEVFIQNKWIEVETIKTSPRHPENGLELYSHKEKMWREFKIPSYIMTHYKIDIENDLIESHVKLYAKDADRTKLQRTINLKREHQ